MANPPIVETYSFRPHDRPITIDLTLTSNTASPTSPLTTLCTACAPFQRPGTTPTSLHSPTSPNDGFRRDLRSLSATIRRRLPVHSTTCRLTKCAEEAPLILLLLFYCLVFILSAIPAALYAMLFCRCEGCIERRKGRSGIIGSSVRALGRLASVPLRTIGFLKPLPPLDPASTEPTCIQRRICRLCSNDEESALPLEPPPAYHSILGNGGSLMDAQPRDSRAEYQQRTA
ncbi:hypothetical protein MMC18_007461 [Xylographa bjoerkii]|nr:hypothetical protein [Xylographa bjoerkii]MCJ1394509.1 hypothetical protein [Xylographa bjoerkii]MCJ1394581.1 hypothetical protein [Xylographa bjoerkii]